MIIVTNTPQLLSPPMSITTTINGVSHCSFPSQENLIIIPISSYYSQHIIVHQTHSNLCWNEVIFSNKAVFVFWKLIFEKLFFKFLCVCLSLEKLINEKHFPVKEKFGLVSRKLFSFYFGWKIFFGNCEKFRNVILFANYIKFSPQTFDCYIYIFFFFWIFVFQFHPLEFNFYINFNLYFYNYYLLFPYHFLIEIFYLSNLILIFFIVTYFIWNNL
jgi:hypothetical protein